MSNYRTITGPEEFLLMIHHNLEDQGRCIPQTQQEGEEKAKRS